MPFDSAYLPLSLLKTRLLAGLYKPENLPPDDDLAFILELAEVRFEEWLGRRLVPTNYLDRYKTDVRGICLIRNFPVLEVHQVSIVPVEQFGHNTNAVSLGPFLGQWWQGRKLMLGRPQITVEVSYTAGLDPVPRIIYLTFLQFVTAILKKSGTTGDLSFLDETNKSLASISLPGGITKTFSGGKTPSGSAPALGVTNLDQLLSGAARYRLSYIT